MGCVIRWYNIINFSEVLCDEPAEDLDNNLYILHI